MRDLANTSPSARLYPRGGARRDPQISSTELSEAECRAMQNGARRAIEIGKPYNRFITVLLEKGGFPERDAAAATRAFIKLIADWLREKGGRLCWTYSLEWGSQNLSHVHILLHIPPDLDKKFRPMPQRWAKSFLPLGKFAGAVLSKRIRGANTPDGVSVGLYDRELWADLYYLMKAAPVALEEPLAMLGRGRPGIRWGQSSLVFGKRSGSWQERRADNQ
ncbi:hypothetical protein [Rhizorhabdus sp.]|uniref:hypothetical protein n=1 Tax=Rhizorhabdus sp. TaxID=1968843 RepID=UPI0019CD0D8C|nr:hypothetical protein [Rhizorhabdus sp.]MBD3761917.1 hypothetical protein [Rhizorhabdus sp.]